MKLLISLIATVSLLAGCATAPVAYSTPAPDQAPAVAQPEGSTWLWVVLGILTAGAVAAAINDQSGDSGGASECRGFSCPGGL